MNNFDLHINDYLNDLLFEDVQKDKYKLGIFIGKFKPPHSGHYNTLAGILGEGDNVFSTRYPQVIPDCTCDEAIVIISDKSKVEDLNDDGMRIEVTADISKSLWELYTQGTSIGDQTEFQTGAPVPAAIGVIEGIRESGNYKGIAIDDLHIRLFVGEEEDDDGEISISNTEKEMKRYSYIVNNQEKLLGSDSDEDRVKVCVMARSASATAVREKIARISIDGQDLETLRDNIPAHVDLNMFWDIASKSLIQ
jgi:hypothetical protein